jgi:hypothetical protein
MLPLTRPLVILHDPSRSPRQLWNQTQRQPKFIPGLSNKPRSTSALGTMKHAQRIVILQVVVSFVRSLRSAVPKNGSHLELGRHHGGQEQHNSWGASFTQYAVFNSTSTEMQIYAQNSMPTTRPSFLLTTARDARRDLPQRLPSIPLHASLFASSFPQGGCRPPPIQSAGAAIIHSGF